MQTTLPHIEETRLPIACRHLPDRWKRVQLDSIVTQITSGSRGWAAYYSDSGSVFVRITKDSRKNYCFIIASVLISFEVKMWSVNCCASPNLQRDSIVLTTTDLRFVKLPKNNTEGSRTRLLHGDVLISITAELGLIGYYNGDFQTDAYVNQHIALVRPDTAMVCPKYIAYTLLSSEMQKDIASRNDSGSKSGLNLNSIRSLELPLPPRHLQEHIIEILETTDAAIIAAQKLIEAKTRYRHALTEQLVTGQRRFLNFTMQKWRETKLDECMKESPSLVEAADQNGRLTVRLHMQGVASRNARGTEIDGATAFLKRRTGQFIYGKQNLHHGAMGIIPEHLDGFSSSQDIPAFDWKKEVDPQFILLYLSRKEYYEQLERLATGTGSKRIHPAALLSVKVNLPSLTEQSKIAEVLGLMDQEIALLRQELEALKRQKQGLMQKLLTGQVRVKEFHP